MNIEYNEFALKLGAYQVALAIVGIAILAWLVWRAARAIIRRSRSQTPMSEREMLQFALPPIAWFAILLIVGVTFTTMQAYGPRIAIPATKLEVNASDAGDAKIRNLSPAKLTDKQRLQQQRQLEAETKSRVNLKE